MIVVGGEFSQGGLGFVNFDNLAIDGWGNFWMVIDMFISKYNCKFEWEVDIMSLDFVGVFGNNFFWYLFLYGFNVGQIFFFVIGLMDSELIGLVFSQD